METIFDHNLTVKETKEILGHSSKDEYLKYIDQKGAYIDIAHLFYMRKKEKKAKRYIEKTEDCDIINSFWRTVKHP